MRQRIPCRHRGRFTEHNSDADRRDWIRDGISNFFELAGRSHSDLDRSEPDLSNAAVVPTGFNIRSASGGIDIYASQMTHVILDINGFYAGAAAGATNTFLGPGAGISSTTGSENTGIGDGALESDTSGNFNTAIGNSALLNNAIGKNNTAVGNFALRVNTSGSTNTAVGDR